MNIALNMNIRVSYSVVDFIIYCSYFYETFITLCNSNKIHFILPFSSGHSERGDASKSIQDFVKQGYEFCCFIFNDTLLT